MYSCLSREKHITQQFNLESHTHVYGVLMENLHKEFPLSDEELGSRHSTETLVGSDEEEGAHPGAIRKAKVWSLGVM